MQKTTLTVDCHQRNRTESEVYEGVQTFMWIIGEKLVEVQTGTHNLLELILTYRNLIQRLMSVDEFAKQNKVQ